MRRKVWFTRNGREERRRNSYRWLGNRVIGALSLCVNESLGLASHAEVMDMAFICHSANFCHLTMGTNHLTKCCEG